MTHADIKKRLTVTPEMQTILQEKTKGQNKSLLCFQLRMCRLMYIIQLWHSSEQNNQL